MTSSKMYKDEIIWIIGASSGIGEALARELAKHQATLILSARRLEALEQLKESLGNNHKAYVLDVTDVELVIRTAQAIRAAFGRIDRVIFLAAAYTPMKISELDIAVSKQIIDINLLSAFHVLHAVLPILKEQQKGQIALCGSVAGYVGLPGGQPYSATKAAIMNLAESLKSELPETIDVKLISPGFVKTSLTDKNQFPMPMIITPEEAAAYIAKGLTSASFEIHFPKAFTVSIKWLNLLPYNFVFKLTRKLIR